MLFCTRFFFEFEGSSYSLLESSSTSFFFTFVRLGPVFHIGGGTIAWKLKGKATKLHNMADGASTDVFPSESTVATSTAKITVRTSATYSYKYGYSCMIIQQHRAKGNF